MKKIFSLIFILLFFLGHSQDFSKLLNNVELDHYYGKNLYNKIIIADEIHLETIDEKFNIKSSMNWLNKDILELINLFRDFSFLSNPPNRNSLQTISSNITLTDHLLYET